MIKSRTPIRSPAVILKSYKSGEADRLIVLFTEKYGKLKGMMKGIRKASCKFRSSSEVGSVVTVSLYYKDKNQDIGRITDMDTIDPLCKARSDYTRILVINYLVNIMDEAWQPNDNHPESFALLVETLHRLEETDSDKVIRGLIRTFELRTLFFLGIHPTLDSCESCGKKAPHPLAFNFRTLSIVCKTCHHAANSTITTVSLKPDFIRFYNQCIDPSNPIPAEILHKDTEQQARVFFRRIFLNFLGHHLNVLKVTDALKG